MKTVNLLALAAVPVLLLADMDRCVSCHGVDFEKRALGVSRVVKGMSEKEIKDAIDGYKRGEGGPKKALMIQEVNLGVDTDAMSADVYAESITPGFDEPNDEFIFQKRLSVRTLHKLKTYIQKADPKKDMSKVSSMIKSVAFTMFVYDDLLKTKVDFKTIKANNKKLSKDDIYSKVSSIKRCVDHSFAEDEIVKCRVDFLTLASSLTRDEEQKMKAKSKKPAIYTGEGAVDISQYIKHH